MALANNGNTLALSEQLNSALGSDQEWHAGDLYDSPDDGYQGSAIVEKIRQIFSELDKEPDLSPAIPALLPALLDKRVLARDFEAEYHGAINVRESCVNDRALELILKIIDKALPDLLALIDNGSEEQENAASYTLIRACENNINTDNAWILPKIIEHLRTVAPDRQQRYFGILQALPSLLCAEVLFDCLASASSEAACKFVRSLGWIFRWVFSQGRSRLYSETPEQIIEFFQARVFPRFALLLQSPQSQLRRAVIYALAEIGAPAKDLLEMLSTADKDDIIAAWPYFKAAITYQNFSSYTFLLQHNDYQVLLGGVKLLYPFGPTKQISAALTRLLQSGEAEIINSTTAFIKEKKINIPELFLE